jgi:8-oxo-dGTP diphosphatase
MTVGPDTLGTSVLPIRTARLGLRRLAEGDAAAIETLAGDPAVALHTLNIPYPYSPGIGAAWVKAANRALTAGIELQLAIERLEDGALIGAIGFGERRNDLTAEIGYWIGKPHWNQGYATEALAAMAAHGFARMSLRAIDAAAEADNTASIRVQEKVGFVPVREERREAANRGTLVTLQVRRLEASVWRAAHPAPMLLVAAVALIDSDGRVLIAQRPAGKPMAGLWEFPGGKLHEAETPEQALVRELDEELGIDTAESCLAPFAFASHRYETFHLLMPLYLCRKWKGRVQPREGQALKWVRPKELRVYPMPPADEPLVALLRDLL